MPPLLPLAYDQSRAAEAKKHIVPLNPVRQSGSVPSDAELSDSAGETSRTQIFDSDVSSDASTLLRSSSSYISSDFQAYINRMKGETDGQLLIEDQRDVPSSPPGEFDFAPEKLPGDPFAPRSITDETEDAPGEGKNPPGQRKNIPGEKLLGDSSTTSQGHSATKGRLRFPVLPVSHSLLLERNSSSLSDTQPVKKRQKLAGGLAEDQEDDADRSGRHSTCRHKLKRTAPVVIKIESSDEEPEISVVSESVREVPALRRDLVVDRNGKVYGLRLAGDRLPSDYHPHPYEDPSFFVGSNTAEVLSRASEAIAASFDHDPHSAVYEAYCLNLDNYGLHSLPEQVADFRDLVVYDRKGELSKPKLQLFASNNRLRSINPRIFDIQGLETLVLRVNRIARVPGAIGKATALRSINLAQNKLKFFPHTILNLPQLRFLTIRPNRLLPVPANEVYSLVDYQIEPSKFHHNGWTLRYTTGLRWTSGGNLFDMTTNKQICPSTTSWVPRLTELVLRKISQYLISQSEIVTWRRTTNDRAYDLAVRALIYGANGEICGRCGKTTVVAAAETMEWWDFNDSGLVPVKRRFCCAECAMSWWDYLECYLPNKRK